MTTTHTTRKPTMTSIEIDESDSTRLEALSCESNTSKGSVALSLCEKFFGKGGAHREPVNDSPSVKGGRK